MNRNLYRLMRLAAAIVGVAVLSSVSLLIAADASSSGTRSAAQPDNSPPAKSPSARWEREIQAYEAADKKHPPPQAAILFIGSSNIRVWQSLPRDFPDQKVINRGFGGSEIADSVYFADRIVIPYKPRLIVMQAGGNDVNNGKSPEQLLADFKAFVTKVHAKLPDTRIAYLGMNPSPARWSQRENEQRGNALIKAYTAADKSLDYIDFWNVLLGPNGKPREDLFNRDRLHNNAAGYELRADAVRPHLK